MKYLEDPWLTQSGLATEIEKYQLHLTNSERKTGCNPLDRFGSIKQPGLAEKQIRSNFEITVETKKNC